MWVIIAPSVFLNKPNFIYIIRSKASFKDKFLSITFFIFAHVLFILRTVLYLGVYPCTILINKDYGEFKTKLAYAETYVIPVTDFLTFLLCLFFVVMGYKSNDRLTDFFELTKPIHIQNTDTGRYDDYNYGFMREDLISRGEERPNADPLKPLQDVKIVITGNSKVGKTWLTVRHTD